MFNSELLTYGSGMGILTSDSKVESISDSEELQLEYCPDIRLNAKVPSLVKEGEIQVWDLAGRAVIPGLVDGHSHLVWAGDRSGEVALREQGYTYQQIADMGGGINKTVRETRKATTSQLLNGAKKRIANAENFGTTFLEAKSGYGLTLQDELKLLEVSNQVGDYFQVETTSTWLGAHSIPDAMKQSDYVEELLSEQLPAVIEQGIATYADVFCEAGWFTIEETEEICKAAKDGGLSIRLHVDEFADCGGAQLAAELGALTADHAAWSTDDARDACSKAGVIQGFLPATPHVLGLDHWPPFQQCIDNEWAWSLATDFNPNCPSLSLPFIAKLAVQQSGIPEMAALVAASRNSACSLLEGRDSKLGTISVGGPASLNVLEGDQLDGWLDGPGDSPFLATLSNGGWVKKPRS
jgi:imidazolonepropionase